MSGLNESLQAIEKAKQGLDYEVGTLLAPDGAVLREYGGEKHAVSTPSWNAGGLRGSGERRKRHERSRRVKREP
ncbi:MAG: hypothetical protein LBL25_00545 [Oscillospiraceae bacterium]|nr:hypothetical protein [Oscillospiraceae bacterium]